MSFTLYDAAAPVFVNGMTNLQTWLDKALADGKSEAALMEARLAPDMRPFPAQIQIASDTAKNAMARLSGMEAPAMADEEASFSELKDRCRRTIAFVESVPRSALDGADEREVVLKLGNGMAFRFTGAAFLTGFALPNFYFHVTTAYALLRAAGVGLGKADFLKNINPPASMDA
jgi:hypothetical protein